jgi:thioredoxin-dependent peroxiredoxin
LILGSGFKKPKFNLFSLNPFSLKNCSKHSDPMPLTLGTPAPDFSLPDANGNMVALANYLGKWVVVYFYPRDLTPGCTTEACEFRDLHEQLLEQQAVVLGISTDEAKSHQKFIAKHNLPFLLLSDSDAAVSTTYESYGPKKFMGKDLVGIYRTTYLIDPVGKLAKIYRKVKPAGHAAQILMDLGQLQQE